MSKKNKNRNRGGKSNPQPQPQRQLEPQAAAPTVDPRVAQIDAAHKEAMDAVRSEEDLVLTTNEPRPDGIGLDKLWETVREARDVFRARTNSADDAVARAKALQVQCESRSADLDSKAASIDARTKNLDAREREIADRSGPLEVRARDLASKEIELTAQAEDLGGRELNAEAGFMTQRKAALAALEAAAAAIREEAAAAERAIGEQRAAWIAEQREHRKRLQEELDAESQARHAELEQALRERREELAKREADAQRVRFELDGLRLKAEYEEQHLKELQQHLDRRVEQRAASFREGLEHQITALNAQLGQARKDRDGYDELLRKREAADRRFGQRTPEQVLKELEDLRAERDGLRSAIAERPDAEAANRLRQLEGDLATWEADRLELQRQVAELERRLARANIAVIDLETLRDKKVALESSRAALQQALTELQTDVGALIHRADEKSTFPACSAMDGDAELQTPGSTEDGVRDLAAFVDDLRHRIAIDPAHPERRLYYALPDVRAFVGGLAMSPLVLLQGISGTGKTSLPVAFARAVGTKATVIEVQAGWRDPQDLIGHYNAFEKRFHEREFLKALYRARTPRWADTIQIVLLDEMNLSHPEQYFSDLLSALELRQEDRRLVLMSHPLERAPALLDAGGSKLPIAPNVWFVGTANHDETTKGFADKTYDRAHVMQFPARPHSFEVRPSTPRHPVSFSALQKAFDEAVKRDEKDGKSAERAIQFLETKIREPLTRYFEISWGPRFERQLRRYVPVVVAAGGSIGEATDHLLAMRLLRKLKNRHDNRPEHLESLAKTIEAAWPEFDRKTNPERSVEILAAERRSRGHAPEDPE